MASFTEKSFVAANDEYAKNFTKAEGNLPLPPGKEYAIVTCMDARIHPSQAFGLALGDAHVIRNAGGNAKDALRSLVISEQLLGTKAIFLVKHTDCGMLTFENKDIHAEIKKNLNVTADDVDFQPFSDLEQAVKDDVAFLKSHELIPVAIKNNISGWIYHVESGKLQKVETN